MYRAKKSLGQNFLKSVKALNAIILAGEVNKKDIVLEIGPGKGVLTEKLLEKAGKVIAVEKDPELIELLKLRFVEEINNNKLLLINEDILEFQIADLKIKKYKVIANIPYYITGAIFKKFLEGDSEGSIQPEIMVILVQKEVAERIVARDKKESILSISVKVFGEPKYIETVAKRYFSPSPKVDSAILLIKNINKNKLLDSNIDNKSFFNIVKTGFAHKRKVLSANLKPLLGSEASKWMGECKIPEKARAEDLILDDWICLAKKL